jgi:hypothetical protein
MRHDQQHRRRRSLIARRGLKNAHQMLCNSDTGLCE